MTNFDIDTDVNSAGNTAAAVAAGLQIAGARPVGDSDRFFTQVVPAGARVETFDIEELEDKLADFPRRKTGTVHVQDAESFIAYLGKHGELQSEVYADLSRMALVGVINAHQGQGGEAGHGDHRVKLELLSTDAWKLWIERDRKILSQQGFAEHLEDRADDVVSPDAATMLEIAQSLIATNGVDFKSAHRLVDGQVQFRYEETTQARAGQAGEIEIPQTFTIEVPPFEGCPPVQLTARFRYRISSSGLQLFYVLNNPADVAREAFIAYVDEVEASIEQPLFKGRPE